MSDIPIIIIAIVVLGTIVGAFATRNVTSNGHRGTSRRPVSLLTSVLLDILLIGLFAVGVLAKLFPVWILAVPIGISVIGITALAVIRASMH